MHEELENDFIEFAKGDAILIDSNKKYYWESSYYVVSVSCTPAWMKNNINI